MAVDNIKFEFKNSFEGKMIAPNGEILIGSEVGSFKPYNLLFGALGSCFYHTFVTIVEKKRLTFDGASLEISGVKRETTPTTLETVEMKFVIKNASNVDKFQQSVDLAAKYCSIHETIAQVAKINLSVEFK